MEFIDLKAQLAAIRPAIDARIARVLDHGQFIMGPEVYELEEKLADYVGVKHCISCANGTDALQLALMALGVGPGDIVFTTAFSFFSTAEVIPLVGATPFFVDIDPMTYNLCPRSLEQAIHKAKQQGLGRPKAVIAVDLFGLPADYPALQRLCDEHHLFLIEDGAQSFGASIKGQKCGSFGHIATTSFFPAKPLGGFGDGGALFTHDEGLAELCQSLRIHGKGADKYENLRVGMNSRLDTLQAAILLEKLPLVEQEAQRKADIASYYHQHLPGHLTPPAAVAGYQSAWALYTVRCEPQTRQMWLDGLRARQVPCMVYYPTLLPQQQALRDTLRVALPVATAECARVFSLPMHAYLSASEIQQVVGAAHEVAMGLDQGEA